MAGGVVVVVVVVVLVVVLGIMAVAMVGWAGRCCRADSSAYTSIEQGHRDWAMGIAADQLGSGGDAGAGSPPKEGLMMSTREISRELARGCSAALEGTTSQNRGRCAWSTRGTRALTMPLTLFSRMVCLA